MSVTIYRRLQDSGEAASRRNSAIKPQIHDLLEYEGLRHKKGK